MADTPASLREVIDRAIDNAMESSAAGEAPEVALAALGVDFEALMAAIGSNVAELYSPGPHFPDLCTRTLVGFILGRRLAAGAESWLRRRCRPRRR